MGDKTLLDGWSDSVDPIVEMEWAHAENLVEKYDISRGDGPLRVESHQKAIAAIKNGWFRTRSRPS